MTIAVHAASNLERPKTSVLWVGPRHFDVMRRRTLRARLYVTWIRCTDEVSRLTISTFDIVILAQQDPAKPREAAEFVLRCPGEAPLLVLMSREDAIWIKDLGESSRRSLIVISDDGGVADWGMLLSANISWLVHRELQLPAPARCSSGSSSRSLVSGSIHPQAVKTARTRLRLAKGLEAEPPVDSIRSGWTGFDLDDGRLHLCKRGEGDCYRSRPLHGILSASARYDGLRWAAPYLQSTIAWTPAKRGASVPRIRSGRPSLGNDVRAVHPSELVAAIAGLGIETNTQCGRGVTANEWS